MGCASANVPNHSGPTAWLLDDGARLHLQHGPIDLIIDAAGAATEIHRAFEQATQAFQCVLDTLASQLPVLRSQYHANNRFIFKGPVAKRMRKAVHPYADYKLTPMAAVAGAVADHILACMVSGRNLERAQVNNGGDIALHLSPGCNFRIGICTSIRSTVPTDAVSISACDNVGGVATSGWRGRSFSLGIADAVTVLASSAACADAAATLIANAVDLPLHKGIGRACALSMQPDSDLGNQLITIDVPFLTEHDKKQALDSGEVCAESLMNQGKIHSCYLHLQGQTRVIESSCFQSVSPVGPHYAIC